MSGGYAGTDPGWSNSIRSHTGVTVDGVEPARIGEVPAVHRFGEMSKWVMAWAEDVYPDVKMARGLLLTDAYLLDVYHLESPRPRAFQWLAQTLGHAVPDHPVDWAQTRHLLGSLYDLERESSRVVGADPWAVTVLQETAGADRRWSGLGDAWFEKPVGVRLHMMGESGTLAYTALGPATAGEVNRLQEGAEEPGGLTVVAARNKARTTFIAVHEPFVDHPKLLEARLLARGDDMALIEVRHDAQRRDWIAVSWAEDAGTTRTLSHEGNTIEFRGHALLRFAADSSVRSEGGLVALAVP